MSHSVSELIRGQTVRTFLARVPSDVTGAIRLICSGATTLAFSIDNWLGFLPVQLPFARNSGKYLRHHFVVQGSMCLGTVLLKRGLRQKFNFIGGPFCRHCKCLRFAKDVFCVVVGPDFPIPGMNECLIARAMASFRTPQQTMIFGDCWTVSAEVTCER